MNSTFNRSMALLCMLALSGAAAANDPADKFKTMDANGDGMVTSDEHAAGARTMFTRMDADGDGNVTTTEMDASHRMKAGAKADKARMSSSEKITAMDTNGDGALSASEHETGAQAKFSEMDTDGNGSLSRQEVAAGHAAMKSGKTTP